MNISEKYLWSYASILTKDELIRYLSEEYGYLSPSKYKFEFFKWKVTDEKLSKAMEEHLNSDKSKALANEYDNAVKAFNAEKDSTKRFNIAQSLVIIQTKLLNEHKIWQRIEAARDKNTKFLEQAQERRNRQINAD